jgi:hypothetical protein
MGTDLIRHLQEKAAGFGLSIAQANQLVITGDYLYVVGF